MNRWIVFSARQGIRTCRDYTADEDNEREKKHLAGGGIAHPVMGSHFSGTTTVGLLAPVLEKTLAKTRNGA